MNGPRILVTLLPTSKESPSRGEEIQSDSGPWLKLYRHVYLFGQSLRIPGTPYLITRLTGRSPVRPVHGMGKESGNAPEVSAGGPALPGYVL